jgi:hypothetical protein
LATIVVSRRSEASAELALLGAVAQHVEHSGEHRGRDGDDGLRTGGI